MPSIQMVFAADIVAELEGILPYEVVITDVDGVVIASSRSQLVGKISDDARLCINSGGTEDVEIKSETNSCGIVSPLYFEKKLVGTVALLGNPKHVLSYIKLVKVTVELLIAQDHLLRAKQQKRQSINEFIMEWLFRVRPYSESFISRGHLLGIRVTSDYCVIMVSNVKDMEYALSCIRSQMEVGDYWYAFNTMSYVVITRKADTLEEKIEAISKMIEGSRIGVGRVHPSLYPSLQDSLSAMEIGQVLKPHESIYYYEQFHFAHELSAIGNQEMFDMIDLLCHDSQGMELIRTIECYIKNQCEIISTAKELYIHRNTLKYRLEKVYHITGKNPRLFEDLFYLYTAIIHYLITIKEQ